LEKQGASPHREEPPQGGVSNGETRPLGAPQDEVSHYCHSQISLILRSRAERSEVRRLEGRTLALQLIFCRASQAGAEDRGDPT
jgi:hypothetical protein